MKKNVFMLAGLFLLSFCSLAQSQLNLVIFAEDGDLFYAYINGIKQNDQPQSNVKITGLTSPNISLRIEFNDKALPQLKQNMALEMGYEHTAKIKRDMKKQLKLRYFGQTPLDNSSAAGVTTVAYHTADNSAAPASQDQSNNTASNSTTTTTQYSNSTNNNGAVNINMNAAGVSMNMSGMDPNVATINSSSSTTLTSSSSSSSGMSNSSANSPDNVSPASTGNTGCSNPMAPASFNKMKESIEAKPFTDTKMSTAKVATKNACLSVSQVKEICKLFTQDDDKLAYAKYAYAYCTDKANYYQVGEIFSFSTTTDDLNKFLEQQ